jgi:hypothetical protein
MDLLDKNYKEQEYGLTKRGEVTNAEQNANLDIAGSRGNYNKSPVFNIIKSMVSAKNRNAVGDQLNSLRSNKVNSEQGIMDNAEARQQNVDTANADLFKSIFGTMGSVFGTIDKNGWTSDSEGMPDDLDMNMTEDDLNILNDKNLGGDLK